ncbi:MAG: hypothetical protein RLP44_02400 [Aggregatilineales bacterium]
MDELREAALIIWDKENEIARVLIFEDHNDACDVMFGMVETRYECSQMVAPEHFKKGEKPADIPLQPRLIE